MLESRLTLTHLRRDALTTIERDMAPTSIDQMRLDIINRDLEVQRERRREILEARLIELRQLLDTSRESIAFREEAFQDAISASLQILNAAPLTAIATSGALAPLASPYQLQANQSLATFRFPRLDEKPQSGQPLLRDSVERLPGHFSNVFTSLGDHYFHTHICDTNLPATYPITSAHAGTLALVLSVNKQ